MSSQVKISIVIPCFNEQDNIPVLFSQLRVALHDLPLAHEFVAINDGSSDATLDVLHKHKDQYPELVVVNHTQNQGIAAAWKSGITKASGQLICLIDADLQNDPKDIVRLYDHWKKTHCDLAQGYRNPTSKNSQIRSFISKGFNQILNFSFAMNLHDNKSGFVLGRKEVFEDVLHFDRKYYYYQSFIAVAAHRNGYRVSDIPTVFHRRLYGKSFMSDVPLRVIFKCLVDVWNALLEFRLSRRFDKELERFLAGRPLQKKDPSLNGWRLVLWNFYFKITPLHKWMITSDAKRYYDSLKQSQYLSKDDLRAYQLGRLKRLVAHSYNHVPYYRDRMNSTGLSPEDIRSLDDLSKLPFLTKDDVRANITGAILADNVNPVERLKIQTSGSTGEPFVCYADRPQLEIRWASTQRSLEWTGYQWGDRCARLWHQTLGMSPLQIFREKTDALFSRRLFIPAFEMKDDNIVRFVNKLKKYQPVLIDGYAESFNFLAHYIKAHDTTGLRPKGMVSSAQILPQSSREVIENKFQCRVFDKYGSREFSGIAYECEQHEGHHVVGESYLVEILKNGVPARPGEVGEVVITDLNNKCLPFIRYRIGDMAVAMDDGDCGCKRGLARIGKIEGRVQAIIRTSDGRFLPGTFFAHFFKEHHEIIRQYQVLQTNENEMTLRIIKADSFDEKKFDRVLSELRHYVGQKMNVVVEFVDRIQMVRTGKHQGSISTLKYDFQDPKYSDHAIASSESLTRNAQNPSGEQL